MEKSSKEITIHSPVNYDWSEFTRKDRGFLSAWCRDHKYANGEEFNYKTVYALIKGDYTGEAGFKIKEIIRSALSEGLIFEYETLEAA
jgi:hypothetical protein